jgi:hypothetical protein
MTQGKVIETIRYVIDDDPYNNTTYLDTCPQCIVLPTVLPRAQRIIAIGDIHGDYNLAVKTLIIGKVIDKNLNWIGKNTIVVQVGDQIDSCRPTPQEDCHNTRLPGDKAEDVKVMELFDEMHSKAQKFGGAVYSLLGNHEIMNVQGRMDYVSYANMHDFHFKDESTGKIYTGPQGRIDAFKPGGAIALKLALRPTIITIGSNMFVHAGILPDLILKLESWRVTPETKLKYLNTIVRKWLISKVQRDQFESIILSDPNLSPFWTRVFGLIKPKTKQELSSNSSRVFGLIKPKTKQESNSNPDSSGVFGLIKPKTKQESDSNNVSSGKPKSSEFNCYSEVKKTLDFFKMGQMIVGHTPQIVHGEGINGTCKFNGKDLLYRVDGGFAESFDNEHKIQVLEIVDDNIFRILEE